MERICCTGQLIPILLRLLALQNEVHLSCQTGQVVLLDTC